MNNIPNNKPVSRRIAAIDVARGLALIAMAIYHFGWDLEFFGYAPPGMTAVGGWKIFARSIAGSFLFLVGVSLVLAHGSHIRWRMFARRLLAIVAAAAAITIATRFATPDRYIFFGILHCIALSSVLGLAFVRVPALISLALGAAVIFLTPSLVAPFFDQPYLLWLGLSTQTVHSNDYVPLLPWFGPVLIGIAVGKFLTRNNLLEPIASIYRGSDWLSSVVAFTGRHSLAFYLLHQPALIGIVYVASLIIPAPAPDPIVRFSNSCNYTCTKENSAQFCNRFCTCTLDELVAADLLETLFEQNEKGMSVAGVQGIVQQCSANAGQ